MKKLLNLIKDKYLLTTLILLGSFVFFSFVLTVWNESAWTGFELSSWIMFLVNSGLVALIVLGLFTKKKELVAVSFTIFGISFLYNLISYTSGISDFFSEISHLGSSIRFAKNNGFTPKVNVPSIFADLIYGSIGFAGLGGFVCLLLGKVVLKKDKLCHIANIILSLIPVAFVALGIFALISHICYESWTSGSNNNYIIVGSYSNNYIINCLARASLWTSLALVAFLGLPEKNAKQVKETKQEELNEQTNETNN